MIIKCAQLPKSDDEEQFANWLTTQRNANGKVFRQTVAKCYARNLRTEPPKIDMPLSLSERDIYSCRTVAAFDEFNYMIQNAPNFREVNRSAHHGAFSAGLAAYRRYVQYTDESRETEMNKQEVSVASAETFSGPLHIRSAELQRVVFSKTQVYKRTDPYSCMIESTNVSIRGNWCDLLVDIVELFLKIKKEQIETYKFKYGRPLLMDYPLPSLRCKMLDNGKTILVNYSIETIVQLIGKLCSACGVDLNDVIITCVPKSVTGGKMINCPDLFRNGGNTAVETAVVPDALIEALNRIYSTGFRFETTYINLLSNASGVEIDEKTQSALKRLMFRRDDGIYFLVATVADDVTIKDIVDSADFYLDEYGCFEIPEFYKLYVGKVNSACIRNAGDFESFYEQIGKSGVRCVQAPSVGNRIARYSNGSVWGTFKKVAERIVAVISEEYYGSCNEEDLHTKFCAFSTELLRKIIKQCAADDLIRVEINDSVCYQTYDALILPENFSEQLAEVVERMDEIGLTIYRDALHTALSLKLGVNFMAEFNLPDWDTFQQLTAAFYKAKPRREWKHYIFEEVTC